MALVEDGTLLGPRQLDMGNSGLGASSTFTQTLVNVNTEMAKARRGEDSNPCQH